MACGHIGLGLGVPPSHRLESPRGRRSQQRGRCDPWVSPSVKGHSHQPQSPSPYRTVYNVHLTPEIIFASNSTPHFHYWLQSYLFGLFWQISNLNPMQRFVLNSFYIVPVASKGGSEKHIAKVCFAHWSTSRLALGSPGCRRSSFVCHHAQNTTLWCFRPYKPYIFWKL